MDDIDRKRLTEFLGICWHEIKEDVPGIMVHLICACGKGYLSYEAMNNHIKGNRTFFLPDDWADLGAVKNRLVETEKWRDFHDYCTQRCDCMLRPHEFEEWLFSPPTFNRLASEFLKGEKK